MIYHSAVSSLQKNFNGLLSGLLLTLSFPNTGWYPIAFLALVPWIVSLRNLTKRESFISGLCMGLTHFLTLIYWIVPTVHEYGQLHIALAAACLILLCLYLSLYPAVFAFLLKKSPPPPLWTPFWAAALWTSLEYVRAHAFTGFAWGALGYSQYSNALILQIADFSGVFGVSFLIVFVNVSLSLAWLVLKRKLPKKNLLTIGCSILLLSAALIYGRHQLRAVTAEMDTASNAAISVIQGNIEQAVKWNTAFKNATVEKYTRLSESVYKKNPDLIIWPETALPFYYGFDQELSGRVDQCIRKGKGNFLIGSPAFERDDEQLHYYNRAYMLNRLSLVTGTYDKTHLVPFGEYVPFGNYLTFLGKLTAHAGNFSRGSGQFSPLAFNNHKTGVLICFEILFPSIAANFVKNGADMLTTITNDAWFGYTSAARQHFAIAVFRAVENRRSLARAANTGISGFIDPVGRVFDTTTLFKDQAITRSLPMLDRISIYTKYGDFFAWGCILAFFFGFMVKKAQQTF